MPKELSLCSNFIFLLGLSSYFGTKYFLFVSKSFFVKTDLGILGMFKQKYQIYYRNIAGGEYELSINNSLILNYIRSHILFLEINITEKFVRITKMQYICAMI